MIYDIIKSGKRICQLRTQNGYTQEGLAKTLNIDRSNLSRIESGKRGCSLELLVQLSILFNVTLDYLVLDRDRTDTSGVDTKANLKGDIEALIRQLGRPRTIHQKNKTASQRKPAVGEVVLNCLCAN